MQVRNLTATEILLIQLILYSGIFLWNEHIGFILATIFASVSLAILLISYIVEWIERSKVPAWYFRVMWISVLCPVLALIFFSLLGAFSTLQL